MARRRRERPPQARARRTASLSLACDNNFKIHPVLLTSNMTTAYSVVTYRMPIGGVSVAEKKTDLLQGTLDMLVLKALALGPLHGLGVSHRIEQITRGTFRVKPGSLFPALHRMEEAGCLASAWGESENNRRAKYYRLTKAGQRQLEAEAKDWQRISLAIASALQSA